MHNLTLFTMMNSREIFLQKIEYHSYIHSTQLIVKVHECNKHDCSCKANCGNGLHEYYGTIEKLARLTSVRHVDVSRKEREAHHMIMNKNMRNRSSELLTQTASMLHVRPNCLGQ
jgi:hypothetical protein